MNIKEAKAQIRNAVTAYLSRDELGAWEIPPEQQRPIFLMGAPGIGKTAIMRQIAQELHIALVSYSMTHHTRQSALGLPHIVEKPWGTATEYTMSEIIAAVHETMARTGLKEGILFLDEINCVSETLAPSMLQFLQFKTFGQHRVPEGWVIVTAGNPPEYNRAVREFDVVMLDRLKVLRVEPDFAAWKEYAAARQLHPAVTGFLEARKDAFYLVESTPEGKQYVTARGWEDLSAMLRLYEKKGLPVDEALIGQYLCSRRVCADFAAYYELFRKYAEEFSVADILAGQADESVLERARAARFDERYAVLGLLLDGLSASLRGALREHGALTALLAILQGVKAQAMGGASAAALMAAEGDRLRAELAAQEREGLLSGEALAEKRLLAQLVDALAAPGSAWPQLKEAFAAQLEAHRQRAAEASAMLDNAFTFCEAAFGDGREMLILVTEMTVRPAISGFIAQFGCEKYFAHNRDLLFYERKKEIEEKLGRLRVEALGE